MSPTTPPNTTPEPAPRKRSRARTFFYIVWGIIGALVLAVVLAVIFGSGDPGTTTASTTSTNLAPSSAPPAPTTAPAAAPLADPKASGNGTCDVSLDPGLNGNDYLVAQANIHNTGNVGVRVRLQVKFPQVGFAPIVRSRTFQLPVHGRHEANVRVAAKDYGYDVIGAFQDTTAYQNGRDGCHYKLTVLGTYGPVQS